MEGRRRMDIYTLPNVKEIASGKQPHSTGRSARCFVTAWGVGWGGQEGGRCGREEIWERVYMCS